MKPTTKIMAMVKAYGYGLGPTGVSKIMEAEKVDYLGVANILEGVELRKAGITLPIMVMKPELESFDLIIEHQLSPVIFSFHSLKALIKALDKHPKKFKSYLINIKLDTGMHRLGFNPNEVPELISQLKKHPNIKVESVFSHLAASDQAEHDNFTHHQIKLFDELFKKFEQHFNYKIEKHLLNSNGALRFPEAQYDMVRLGIGLYGFIADAKHDKHIKNVAVLKAKIAQVKTIQKSETVGYSRKGLAVKETKIATIPIGYADGMSRLLSNGNWQMKVNGKPVPTIGSVCMDMVMLDVTDVLCKEDDEVFVFYDKKSILKISELLQTIPYEILATISPRVKRVFTTN